MPDRGFRTITVTDQIYEKVKQRAKKESKSVATFASQALEIMLFVEEKSVDKDEVIIKDNKVDRVVAIKAKSSDNGKVRFYCDLDDTDYCPHTAFAAALPQVRNAIRR
jgi:predicted CopG family antitoxin